jgi:hypothetical protein
MTPSLWSYRQYLNDVMPAVRQFLEFTVHDDGEGIASHFARHRMRQEHDIDSFDIYGVDPVREWTFLKHAFERHTSSKYFRDTVDQPLDDLTFRPGIGLAAMLSATRALNVYVDVRAGRMRVYRWFKREERVDAASLVHPETPPTAASLVRGTLVRMLVPIEPQ